MGCHASSSNAASSTFDELASLPKGRAIVLASGARPTLIRTQPWMNGPHADAVTASIANHDPEAQRTLAEAQLRLREVAAEEAHRKDHP